MTAPAPLDELIALARGPVRPLAPAERDRVRDGVLAAARAPGAGLGALPHEPPVAGRRTARTAAVVAAVALAAGLLAYVVPGSTTAPRPPAPHGVPPTPPGPVPRVAGATTGPSISTPAPPAPVPRVAGATAPAPPSVIPPTAFEQQRIAGDKLIFPDDATKVAIHRAGVTRLIVPLKVCVTRTGDVDVAAVLKPSGFPAYDAHLVDEVRRWRYTPFVIDGRPTPVCSIVQFVYSQQ